MHAPSDRVRRSLPRLLVTALVALATLLYPFLVYFSLAKWDPRLLAGIMLALLGLRALMLRGESLSALRGFLPLGVAIGLCMGVVMWRGDGELLLYYPVLVNLTVLGSFAWSLVSPPPMIERFARLMEGELPEPAIAYCRKVTVVWCGFFTVNGGIALATALFADLGTWAFYNGFLAYVLMGLLFAIEYVVRRAYKRRHGISRTR